MLSEFQYHEKHEHKKGEEGMGMFEQAVDEAHAGEESKWGWNVADDPSFHKELEVHSGLPNATLKIEIEKSKLLPVEGVSSSKSVPRNRGESDWH